MTTASSIAKVSVGRSGCGAAHASYITRMSALEPEGRDRARRNAEERFEQLSLLTHDQAEETEPSVTETLRDNLDYRSLNAEKEHGGGVQRDADPVWTRNAPDFLTDINGRNPELGQSNVSEKLTLKEKTENLRLYFGSLEDYERRKGGRTHYRIILSFDVPATNLQIRDLTNHFLEQTFPKAIAFGAIHRDTDHPHVHLYLNSRQTDGRRIQLKNNEFKTIDEKWSKIYTDFAVDKSAHVEYLRKKEETKQWKIAAAEAYRKGEPIPPKPERDNDRREKLAEQRLSAQRSGANDRGAQLESRPQAEPLSRAASEKETSRLLARAEVAQEHLAHLIRTDAPDAQIKSAARFALDLSGVLEKTVVTRKEIGREMLPQVVYTTEEWKQLKEYRASSDAPVKDDHAAARLQAGRVLAGAEMRTAHEKDDAFHASYHLWKFDVEGWDRRLSLVDVEKAIKDKAEEKFKLYNFLRPSKREEIQGQIDYLRGVKRDIQKQLASKELSIDKSLGAAEARYQIACKQVEQVQNARAEQGKEMPAPSHTKDELSRMNEIAVRDKNAGLLLYVWDQVKDRVLAKAGPEDLGRIKGSAVMAKLDMVREKERLDHAVCFGEFRHLPNIDKRGFLDTQRLRDVSPRSALETIIRHFTDSVEQKQEQRDLADTLRQQVARAQELAINAREYSAAIDKILGDHCQAARVGFTRANPSLNQQQIAEVREFTQKLPSLNPSRIELNDWAQQGEQLLQAREAAEAARQAEQARGREPMNRSVDQSSSQERTRIDRSDRDSYSRGR